MNNTRKISLRGAALRVGLIAACVMLVTWMLPREKRSGFDVKVNKPWIHRQLIADYDFPIYKSDETLAHERDSVERLFQPYYNEDASVGRTQITRFRGDVAEGRLKGMPAALAHVVAQRLGEIYTAGVVKAEEARALTDSGVTALRVVRNREAESRELGAVYSTRTAYGYLLNADTAVATHEQLAQYDLIEYIEPNLSYDEKRSRTAKRDLMDAISPTHGLVQRGQKIIDRGEIVTPQTYEILRSLEKESQVRSIPTKGMRIMILGQLLLVVVAFGAFFIYVKIYRHDYMLDMSRFAFMLTVLTVFPIAITLLPSSSRALTFIVPFAMAGIFMRIFTDANTAFLALGCTILTSALALADPFEFVIVNMAAGVAAIYTIHDLQQRSQLFQMAVVATLAALFTAAAYDLSQGTEPKDFDEMLYVYIFVSGIFLLFSYPLLYIVEKAFGFVSSVSLIELSNINNPLLRRMSREAAGTFNHSMQVSNLAADAAVKIGANALLVRTGAFYHDIGKLKNPAFFTENQSGVNPHDQLSPESSARIIISHVTEGLKLAEKYRLPQQVRQFITTHHGTSKAKYFYITWLNAHPGEEPPEGTFSYPGPDPSTREQAVLMMADSVEAASRSLKEYTEESISKLVDKIIDTQMSEGHFRECPITFQDIADTKRVFVDNLKTIYHSRIQYPEANADTKPADREARQRQRNFGNIFNNFRK